MGSWHFRQLMLLLIGVLVFQYAAYAFDSQLPVSTDRTAYSPGDIVHIFINGSALNGTSNLTASVMSPSYAQTWLTLVPAGNGGYAAEYSPQQGVVLGTYTVLVTGEQFFETANFDIRSLYISSELNALYPPGSIPISGTVVDSATLVPVNASVNITVDGQVLSTLATEGFFSAEYLADSRGKKTVSINAVDAENITGSTSVEFEVYASATENLTISTSKGSYEAGEIVEVYVSSGVGVPAVWVSDPLGNPTYLLVNETEGTYLGEFYPGSEAVPGEYWAEAEVQNNGSIENVKVPFDVTPEGEADSGGFLLLFESDPAEDSVFTSVTDIPDPAVQGENITIYANVSETFEVSNVLVNIGGVNYTMDEGVIAEETLFFDGFESGNLSTNNWVISGTGKPWFIENKSNKACSGNFSLVATYTDGKDGSGASTVETGIDTTGYNDLNLSFYYSPGGLSDKKDEYFSADWYDGTEWNCLLNTTDNKNTYLLFDSVLPGGACNNPDFKLRFNCYSRNSDDVRIDDVKLRINGGGSVPFQYSFNTSSLSPGVYGYTIYAINASGEEAVPVTGNFTVVATSGSGSGTTPFEGGGGGELPGSDTEAPVINLILDSPDPVERGENISISANVTDNAGVGAVLVEIGGSNYTMSLQAEANMYVYSFNTSSLLSGTHNYTVYASDATGNPADPMAGNFTVTNSPPILSPIGPVEVNESRELEISLSASDPNGDPITYATNASFGTLAGSTFTWTPGLLDSGVYYAEFTASDGELNDSETVTITVNEAYVTLSVSKRIEKGPAPDSYTVTLNLTSQVDFNCTGLRVYDLIPGSFTLSDPVPACSGSEGNKCYWSLDLAAGEKKTVTYTLAGTGRYCIGDAFIVGVAPQ